MLCYQGFDQDRIPPPLELCIVVLELVMARHSEGFKNPLSATKIAVGNINGVSMKIGNAYKT